MNVLNNIKHVKKKLQEGHIVACNTDTICGLLVNGNNITYINRIYDLKKRPKKKKIVLFLTKEKNLLNYAKNIPEYFFTLYKEFVPGYLTFIFESNEKNKKIFGNTIAIRYPSSLTLTKLINNCNFNILCTSANLSDKNNSSNLTDVKNIFKDKIFYWNNKTCSVNIQSTIIDCTQKTPILLREGFIEFDKILHSLEGNILK